MRRNFSIFVVLLCGSIRYSQCQVPFTGSCPKVNIVESFDLDKYMGTWYEYSKYPFVFEMAQKCQQAVYKNELNDTVAVANTGVFILINRPNTAIGTAKVIAPGQLAVAFRNQEADTANYLVLGTDYGNWAVVFSCRNLTLYGHTKLLWILTRQREPSAKIIAEAKQVITDNKLSATFLMESNQKNCPTIPDPFNEDDQAAEASFSSATTEDQSFTDPLISSTERVIDTA